MISSNKKQDAYNKRKLVEHKKVEKSAWNSLKKYIKQCNNDRLAAEKVVRNEQAKKRRWLNKMEKLYRIVITGCLAEISHTQFNPDSDSRRIMARSISNAIYDLTPKWTGYKSEELIAAQELDPTIPPVLEHFIPRQISGYRLVDYIIERKNITLDEFIAMIYDACWVHYTTKDENNRVVKFQKLGIFTTWDLSYEQAGIKLKRVGDHALDCLWISHLIE